MRDPDDDKEEADGYYMPSLTTDGEFWTCGDFSCDICYDQGGDDEDDD